MKDWESNYWSIPGVTIDGAIEPGEIVRVTIPGGDTTEARVVSVDAEGVGTLRLLPELDVPDLFIAFEEEA